MSTTPGDALAINDEPDHAHDGGCTGCGGRCCGETPEECRGPAPIPWLTSDRCMHFYESRIFDADRREQRIKAQVRVNYEHRLCLIGRQQGPLLFTTTLLPGETVRLYEFDRYRSARSSSERVSVHSSFRQTMSALSQSRNAVSSQAYFETLTEVRTHADASVAVGGGLAGWLSGVSGSSHNSVDVETSVASGAAVQTASEQFGQFAVTSAQSTEAERSLVINHSAEADHQESTHRQLHNANQCYAVTYYVRRVNEVYESSTRVIGVDWRAGSDGPWRSIEDRDDMTPEVKEAIEGILAMLPERGSEARGDRTITLPTDGTLYEAELAHCSSCEPAREEAMRIELEMARVAASRACLETELLELELERRRAVAAGADAVALDVGSWPLAPAASEPKELTEHAGGH